MKRSSVLISRILPQRVMEAAGERFEVVARTRDAPMTVAEATECLQGHDAAVCNFADGFTSEAFNAVGRPRCRILANFGAGYNHIDVSSAKAMGIVVTNTPGTVTDATADIALALILMTARRTVEGDRLARSGSWTGWSPTQLLGAHVTGKRLGVIGLGRIGTAIARRCHFGFGMSVVFFNRSRLDEPGLPARQLDSLHEVAEQCDFLVVSVSGGADSRHLVDAALLSAMQPHAMLVNVSRGDVVDEAALIEALRECRIGGAGLDVYEHEPVIPSELRELDNVVLLPHQGTSVLEVRERMGMMALDNLTAFFEGRTPPNLV